jgi:hypothetical protein
MGERRRLVGGRHLISTVCADEPLTLRLGSGRPTWRAPLIEVRTSLGSLVHLMYVMHAHAIVSFDG